MKTSESPILAKVRGYDIESFVKAGDLQKLAEGLKKVRATVDFGQIVSQLNILIGSGVSINEMGGVEWDQSNSDKISEILAFVCAIWTFLNASYYLEAPDSKDKQLYLFQPHPAQVISIFRIFSVHTGKL